MLLPTEKPLSSTQVGSSTDTSTTPDLGASLSTPSAGTPLGDPPPYEPGTNSQAPGQSRPNLFPVPPHLHPVNFIFDKNAYAAIKGQYVLDPDLPDHQPRRWKTEPNLRVSSSYANVDLEIFIDPRTALRDMSLCNKTSPILIAAESTHAATVLKIHDFHHIRPYDITCKSTYGATTVFLPRNFCGFIEASSSYGAIKFSPEITKEMTNLGRLGKDQEAFLGDISLYEEGVHWHGDRAKISSTYCSVCIYFEDETPPNPFSSKFMGGSSGSPGQFFRKFFGK